MSASVLHKHSLSTRYQSVIVSWAADTTDTMHTETLPRPLSLAGPAHSTPLTDPGQVPCEPAELTTRRAAQCPARHAAQVFPTGKVM